MKMRDEIDARIHATPGSIKYIRRYGRSLRRVMKSLSNERREELLQLAELWNKEGPPRDIQIRYVYQGKSDKHFIDSWTIIAMQQRMQGPDCKNLLRRLTGTWG
jgi:hypothetical protein